MQMIEGTFLTCIWLGILRWADRLGRSCSTANSRRGKEEKNVQLEGMAKNWRWSMEEQKIRWNRPKKLAKCAEKRMEGNEEQMANFHKSQILVKVNVFPPPPLYHLGESYEKSAEGNHHQKVQSMKKEREERVQSFCIICTTFWGKMGKSEGQLLCLPHLYFWPPSSFGLAAGGGGGLH
jgi:hypothetical protein